MQTQARFTFFDPPNGRCGIAWAARGVVGVLLPERTEAAARARFARRFPEARQAEPPPEIRGIIDAVVALLAGERRDLSDVPLDLEGLPAFSRGVYEIARAIPPGE